MTKLPTSFAGSPKTIGDALSWAAKHLADAGVERPLAEARILLEATMGLGRGHIIAYPEHALTVGQRDSFDELIARRYAREPISRILGRREFWSLNFEIYPGTLDPRPDSETLVTAVLDRISDRNAETTILDLGTGTGCLLLALLSELPRAQGVGVDISEDAVSTARGNAEKLLLSERVDFRVADWARDISAQFNIIISNPPYIESSVIDGLAPEVSKYDPRGALDGGADGLDAYRALVPEAARLLAPGGSLALEIGQGQGDSVREIAERLGLRDLGSKCDLAGIERCLIFGKS